MIYDVAVSGLGPAGTAFLKEIAGSGLKIVAFDKSDFPRWKPCAGGLTPRSLRLLLSLFPGADGLVRKKTSTLFLFNGESGVKVKAKSSLVFFTDREELDAFLFRRTAEISEADIHLKEEVLGIEEGEGTYRVVTSKNSYSARVVIVADGVNSRIARQFGIKREIGFTYEMDLEGRDERVIIDFTGFKWGYYWLFPKGDFVTVGVGEFRKRPGDLRERLREFNRKHGVRSGAIRASGFPIPCGRWDCDVLRGRVLFLGDAGGLVDPLTGEGIYSAVKSGILAGKVVRDAFEKGDFELLSRYKDLVRNELGKEYLWSKIAGNLFYRFRKMNFWLMDRDDYAGRLASLVFSGKISYREGVFKFLRILLKNLGECLCFRSP